MLASYITKYFHVTVTRPVKTLSKKQLTILSLLLSLLHHDHGQHSIVTTAIYNLQTIKDQMQGHSRRSGWSSFSRTTISQGKNKFPFY